MFEGNEGALALCGQKGGRQHERRSKPSVRYDKIVDSDAEHAEPEFDSARNDLPRPIGADKANEYALGFQERLARAVPGANDTKDWPRSRGG